MKETNLKKIIPYLFVVLIGAIAVVTTLVITAPRSNITPSGNESNETDEDETIVFPTANALDIAKIEALMGAYYKAKIENDAETLNKIVEAETPYSVSELTNETQYISKFDSFYTYVIPGLTENDFIVYETYDIFFRGIETGAPSLNHFIVKKTEDGQYLINAKEISGEFAEYVTKTENSKTVKALRDEVDENLKKACDTDPDLKELISLLSGEEPETTESESPSDSSSAESESGSTESESESETKKED